MYIYMHIYIYLFIPISNFLVPIDVIPRAAHSGSMWILM